MNERLKAIRKSENLTLEEFGKMLGVTKAAISRLESGERNLTEQMIISISRTFRINENWLRTGEGKMKTESTRNQEIASFANKLMSDMDDSFQKRLFSALSKLNESDWIVLEKIADELAKKDEE